MTLRTLLSASLLAVVLLGGCEELYEDSLQAGDGVADEYMRLDIYPSDLNATLLPESHRVDGWWLDELTLAMSTPIQVAGMITGIPEGLTDGTDIDRDLPVSARIEAWVEGSVQGATDTADGLSGRFSLDLPPATAYAVAVVPEDGSGLPFAVFTDQALLTDTDDWDVHLANGARLHGRVTDAEGEPLTGVVVRPVHLATGVDGTAVATDEDGTWVLRVAPGSYDLVFSAPTGSLLPTTTLTIEADEDEDTAVDLDVGTIAPVVATGRVMDESTHRPVGATALSFRSRNLAHHPDATLEITATTDADGAYSVTLLPGSWQVALVPPADRSLTPQRESFELDEGEQDADLGIAWLAPCVLVDAVVRDQAGQLAAGVTVVASEDGISGRTFAATTDAGGNLSLTVPATALHLVLTPADRASAVTHLDVEGGDFPTSLSLGLGRLLTGHVQHQGMPVQSALVEIRDGHTDRLWASTITDEEGSFQIRLATDAADLAPEPDEDASWDTAAAE